MDAVWITALVTGGCVAGLSLLAEKVGGVLGGMFAAAPVTTSAAILFVGDGFNQAQSLDLIQQGSRSLLFALLALPAFFYPIKFTTARTPQVLRFVYAFGSYLLVFTAGTLLSDRLPILWDYQWFLIGPLFVWFLFGSFGKERVPKRFLRGDPPKPSWLDLAVRFALGAAVIFLVDGARAIDPAISKAWSVFPGSFLATLGIVFVRRGAAFAAKASQGGIIGAGSVYAYLLVLLVMVLWMGPTGLIWGQIPAWLVYGACLYPLVRSNRPKPPNAPTVAERPA